MSWLWEFLNLPTNLTRSSEFIYDHLKNSLFTISCLDFELCCSAVCFLVLCCWRKQVEQLHLGDICVELIRTGDTPSRSILIVLYGLPDSRQPYTRILQCLNLKHFSLFFLLSFNLLLHYILTYILLVHRYRKYSLPLSGSICASLYLSCRAITIFLKLARSEALLPLLGLGVLNSLNLGNIFAGKKLLNNSLRTVKTPERPVQDQLRPNAEQHSNQRKREHS